MKYKQSVYTPIVLLLTTLRFTGGTENPRALNTKVNHVSNLERIISMWNRSSEYSPPEGDTKEEEFQKGVSFSEEMSRCIENHQFEITENYTQGKNIILTCFKTTLALRILKYLGGSGSEIKFFDGVIELKKIPDCDSNEGGEGNDICSEKYSRNFEKKRTDYVRIYKKAMQKLISERSRLNAYRNETLEKKENLLERIEDNSQKYLSEVVRSFENEKAEEMEEENIKREISDPKLLSLLDAFTKNYMLKFRFYPGVAARMMRSQNGGVTFDLEMNDSSEEAEDDEEEDEGEISDEGSTREIKYDGPQAKDYMDDDSDEEDSGNRKKKGKKGSKKKKKEAKKKAKKVKKILPYLLIPIMIQMTLLPFVFKKLFFLAMKALFAGKVALILIGFNLLRNTCIKNDDYAQRIRVEHYGYKKGEEYGAWINGRSLGGVVDLGEVAFRGQKPVSY